MVRFSIKVNLIFIFCNFFLINQYMINYNDKIKKMYKFIKFTIDYILAVSLFFFFLPLFLLISLSILIIDGYPIFFIQKRVGFKNRIFKIYKFRTLKTNAPHELATNQFKDLNSYLTKTGKFLRKTSLDELPQILNIIFGNMSFIGPRPLLWNQYNLINQRQEDKSNLIKPGITGLAQISKVAEVDDNVKIRLDKIYFDSYSFKQDLFILIKTILFFLQKLFLN